MADADVIAQLKPSQVVALTIFGEARGSSKELREGIASVIVNRVKAQRKGWGLTPASVCLKPWQFSCWTPKGGAANYAAVMEAARLIVSGVELHEVPPVLMGCLLLGIGVETKQHEDTVHRATHYFSPEAMVPKGRVPAWAVGLEPVAVIETTRFYAGVK